MTQAANMKAIHTLTNSLLWVAVALFASCGSCGDVEGDKNGTDNNNENTNGTPNGTPNANPGACVVGTDCPSGICDAGTCRIIGDNNEQCETPSACGNCDPFCQLDEAGPNTDTPFTLDNDDHEASQGVVLDDEGAVTIDIRRIEQKYIWISNTGEGTISKVDTDTLEEVARYWSGPAGGSNDPSRTSVNTFGDVYVGNRSGRTVTKISGLGEDCADNNGDGVITTSSGPNDVLDWGQDDCILWSVPVPDGGLIRAVAAQDARKNDDTARPAVWIGGWNGIVWKLDGERGDILVETQSPVSCYGFALDGEGNLWISGWSNGALGRIDTHRCTTTANCDVATMDGEEHDTAVKQRIPLGHSPYGITVDFKQRVWVGGQRTLRYDPTQPVGSRSVSVDDVPFIHGITADDKGFIWGAGMGNGIVRYDAEDPTQHLEVPGTQTSAKGMAIDLDGKVWAINISHDDSTVVVPGPTLNDNTVTPNVNPQHQSPYTYSDMTGSQLRFATDQRGFYRRVFEGCPTDGDFLPTVYRELRFDTETPGGSEIVIRLRGANTRAALDMAGWIDVATIPPATSPLNIEQVVKDAGLQGMQFIEIEAELTAVRDANNNVFAPRLKELELTYNCERRVN